MNPCPSLEKLQQLKLNRLDETEYQQIDTHVEACAKCQQALDDLTMADFGMLRILLPKDPSAAAADRAPSVPGYEILDTLGRGGMGVVYKARHLQLNRLVALKMIVAGAHAGPELRARFRREAEAVVKNVPL